MARPGGWGRRPAERRSDERRIYRVGEVAEAIRDHLGRRFRDFWVEGELTGVSQSRQGHVYFQLSDEREMAQISGIVFATERRAVKARLVDGERVRVRAAVDFYAARGTTQLQVKTMLPAGDGDLAARIEAIRKKLAAEGLFDESRKRPLPMAPRTIGVVTSARSAAWRDIVRVAHERAPVRLVIADCQTQGDMAPRSIVVALEAIQRLPEVEVILIGRGGGSAEDLWAFNAEAVCRAIAEARVPVVCGVGHESDTTLAELIADVRASTPSNAAERAVPDERALRQVLGGLEHRLQSALSGQIDRAHIALERWLRRLGDPRSVLLGEHRAITELDRRAKRAVQGTLAARRQRIERLRARLDRRSPRATLREDAARLRALDQRLRRAIDLRLQNERRDHERRTDRLPRAVARTFATHQRAHATRTERLRGQGRPAIAQARARLGQLGGRLDALSPLRVLARGYGIVFGPEGQALRAASEVATGDAIRVRLHEGVLRARVEESE